MDDDLGPKRMEQGVDGFGIERVGHDRLRPHAFDEVRLVGMAGQAGHGMPRGDQGWNQMATDGAGSARNENPHVAISCRCKNGR